MAGVMAFLASSAATEDTRLLAISDRAAVAWAGKTASQVVAVCPPDDAEAAAYAVAAGCVLARFPDSMPSAPFDLAWIGSGFLERWGDDFAARLAESHAASLVFEVLSCELALDGSKTVIRDAGRGARDVIRIVGSAVLVASASAARPDYVSRHRRQQARQQLAVCESPGRSVDNNLLEWAPIRPRTRRAPSTGSQSSLDERMDSAFGMSTRQDSMSNLPIVADPETCAQHLVRYLAHHGFLRRAPQIDRILEAVQIAAGGASLSQPAPGTQSDALPRGGLTAAMSRRPRQPRDSVERRVRQPRRMDSTNESAFVASPTDRRPRPAGKPRGIDRGPRRLFAQETLSSSGV